MPLGGRQADVIGGVTDVHHEAAGGKVYVVNNATDKARLGADGQSGMK